MKITSITNCKEYAWVGETLYTIDVNNSFCVETLPVLKGNFSIRGLTDDLIWLFDQLNFKTLVYSKHGLVNVINDYGIIIRYPINSDRYIVGINSGGKLYTGLYNIKTFRLEREFDKLGYNGVYLMLNDELFVSRNKQFIALFNLENDTIWQHSFTDLIQSEPATLRGKILGYNDKLFFVVDGNENQGMLCIDSLTGKVLHEFRGFSYELFQNVSFIYTTKYENILCKIDTESLEVEEWNVNDLIKENGFDSIHDHRCAAHDNKFYFSQSLGDNKAKLGVLDWDKKKLVFRYEFKPVNGAVRSVHVNDTRIFVHTQDNTLHIFEKE
ncbi:MAG: hypothetical protein ACWA6U_11820 [Breznakibacter sp.]